MISPAERLFRDYRSGRAAEFSTIMGNGVACRLAPIRIRRALIDCRASVLFAMIIGKLRAAADFATLKRLRLHSFSLIISRFSIVALPHHYTFLFTSSCHQKQHEAQSISSSDAPWLASPPQRLCRR